MSEEKNELKDHPLCSVKGIGSVTAGKLIEKGITLVEQLAVMRPEELSDILQVTKKAAKDIVNDAKSQALDKAIILGTFNDVIKHRKEIVQRIPTGSSNFDKIMKGGIPTEAITVFKGEFASGKTQMCDQLAVNCIKYLKRKVAWIETETGCFVPERFQEIAKAIGLEINGDKDFIYSGSQNITTPYALLLAIQRIEMQIQKDNLDIGLLVIDSFTAPFRSFYHGREMLPDRASEISRHLGYLDQLAKKYNMAIVLTSQVMDIPDPGAQLGERVKSGHAKRMWGGNVLSHGGTYLISLQQVAGVQWEGIVFDAPDVPRTSFRFKIISAGVRDV